MRYTRKAATIRAGYLLPLLILALASTGERSYAENVRLAILPGEGERAPGEEVIAQLEVALTQEKDVTLLERAKVRKILREQNLSAAGLTDPATAIRVGTLLSVEMFLFIEKIPKSAPTACRIQIIETKTGIALASTLDEAQHIADTPADLMQTVRLALAKQRVPMENRHYVGILGVRNEEPGRFLDGLVQAVNALLPVHLAQSQNIVLLDREHLDRLRQEESLAGALLDLRNSAVLVEGGVRRAADRTGINLTLNITPMVGGPVSISELTIPEKDAPTVTRRVAHAIADFLHAPAVEKSSDSKREADAFDREAILRLLAHDYDGARRAAEAALALEPTHERKLQLAKILAALLEAGWGPYLRRYEALTEGEKRHLLTAAIRLKTLAAEVYRENLRRREDGQKVRKLFPRIGLNDGFQGAPGYCFKPAKGEIGALQDELVELEEGLFQMQLQYALRAWEERGEEACGLYWDLWRRFKVRMRYEQQEGLAEAQIRLLRRAMDAVTEPPLPISPALDYKRLDVFFALAQNFQNYDNLPEDRAAFVRLFREWTTHHDPIIRMIAYSCLVALKEDPKHAAEEVLATFYENYPHGHPARSPRGEMLVFHPLVARAMTAFGWDDIASMEKHCRRILIPYLDSDKVSYLTKWKFLANQWMGALAHNKRLEEADALAARILDVLEHDTNKRVNLRRDSWIEELQSRRACLAQQLGKTPRHDDAWDAYESRPVLFKGIEHSMLSKVRENRFCSIKESRAWHLPNPIVIQAYAFPAGGAPLAEARITIPPPQLTEGFTSCVNSLTWSASHVYVGTRSGIVSVPFDGGEARLITERDGLPGDDVNAVEWHEGRLYVGFGGSYAAKRGLASYDAETHVWRLIASTAGTGETRGRFNGILLHMLSDPKRKCLWLLAQNGEIWRFTPANETFELAYASGMLFGLNGMEAAAWHGPHLLLNGASHIALLNLDTLSPTWISGTYEPNIRRPARCDGPPLFPCTGIGFSPAAMEGGDLITQRWTGAGSELILHRKGLPKAVQHVSQDGVRGFHWTPLGTLVVCGENSFLLRKKASTVFLETEK